MPWIPATVTATIAILYATLRRIVYPAGCAAREHVERNGTHRVLMEAIPIKLRVGSAWCPGDVLRALATERELRLVVDDMTRSVAEQMRANRQARQLAAAVTRHCANAAAVRAKWRDLVEHPRRSSSGTESFNNHGSIGVAVQRGLTKPQ